MKTTHVCLVSAQPLPNLLPALNPATRPDEVVLLVSADMQDKAKLLRHNLENNGCRVEEVAVHPYHIDEIRATVLALLARIEGQTVTLNATGGTKVMALGAYDVFREFEQPAFYIDTDNRQWITLLPSPLMTPLNELTTVKIALGAGGYAIEKIGSFQVTPVRQELGDYLVRQVERLQGAIGELNGCASSAKKGLHARLEPRTLNNPALAELLERFATAGLLAVADDRVIFKDEESRLFANGGWLEEYVVKTANRLKGQKQIHDHLSNVVIVSPGGVKNEIDLAFTAGNRLHLIECKTALINSRSKTGRVDGVAYKLEALRDLVGGTFAKALLVSYRALTPEDRNRCREYRIEVVEGARIAELFSHLQRWMS